MKLRNKKTGEIRELPRDYMEMPGGPLYYSLAELNEDWEDYKEPKGYWYYDTTKNGVDKITHLEDKEKDQAIGNYFETKEEAEEAVRKLRAIKSLKDKGFRFTGWELRANEAGLVIKANCVPDSVNELDILFRGEYEAKE